VHERPAPLTEKDIPNLDIQLKENFVQDHEHEVMALSLAMARAMEQEKAVDLDAREAVESLVKTYRTLQSGLIYESRPQNPYAAAIQERISQAIEELRKLMAEEAGMQMLRDTDVLATLVFLQRLEIQHNNGRRRGRAFFDFLRTYFPEPAPGVQT
jgi:Asp-tRNA(Asn)/Glu-tRNA(Gln) amidotransferase A subunit family amidase